MLYVNPLEASSPYGAGAAVPSGKDAKALEEFERVFLYQLLREMRKTVPEGGLFEKSAQEKFFEETMDDALAGEMARSGQFGIAAQIQAQWKTVQTARENRDNGLLQETGKALRLHPDLRGLPLASEPTIKPLVSPSSPKPGLPINKQTPLTFHGPASR